MIKNRIVERGEKPASQFQANPKNWRQHPKAQRETLQAVLGEVGWVQGVIENKRTGNLIDGHERVWQALQANDAKVPYVAVDLSESEEALILATFDPISAMAVTDKAMLEDVMRDVNTTNATLTQMLTDMAEQEGIIFGDGNYNVDSEQASLKLSERFIVPPFSVLDARQGYWQERKRAWIALGIQSELGRGGEANKNGNGGRSNAAKRKV